MLSIGIAFPAAAAIRVVDDAGYTVELPAPAKRIVSLAPHVTELLFSAGAGSHIVATVDYSDYPPAAKAIPRIGGSSGLDVERILALRPDLIVGWASGNPKKFIARLRSLGLPVFLTEPRALTDIAKHLRQLGQLAGTVSTSQLAARRFVDRYRAIAAAHADRPTVRVFYQVLDPLLITVNRDHVITEALRLCGGENSFAALPVLAPTISEEAVMKEDPDAIVAGGTEAEWRLWRERWRARGGLTAVKRDALYFVSADLLHRPTLRILDGVEQLCEVLEDARRRR